MLLEVNSSTGGKPGIIVRLPARRFSEKSPALNLWPEIPAMNGMVRKNAKDAGMKRAL